MSTKFLDYTGLSYFWGKLKTYFAPVSHTHTSYAVKHSYTTAANAAKNWYRIANANTSQTDTTKPIHVQFILTAYNSSYDTGYYERWFVNAEVFGRTAHIVILGNTATPFSQARILYENTIADLDVNDRPAIDIYLNYKLVNGTTKIEVEEVYNSGWTFVANGQLAASTVPSGFENVACSVRNNGVERSTYADYVSYLNRQISNITAAFTLADSYLYRSRTLNCTGTFTITVPSINSGYMWCVIKNKNTSSGVITLHPSTTSVLIDGSNADITLQPMEYVCIHSAGANNYSLIADGRWKNLKADKATTLAGYGITDAKIANGTITLGSNTITPLTSHQSLSNYVTLNGTQTVSGAKTFSSNVTLDGCALRLKASGTVNNPSVSNTDSIIQGLVGGSDSVGLHALIGARGSTIVKAGENGDTYFANYEGANDEALVLFADGLIRFITNGNDYQNKKEIILNTYGNLSGLNNVSAESFTGSLTGNADTATSASKLASSFTISLSGDASGSVATNGTGTATISVAVADDSHNHVISNVDGLQTALDAKAADSAVVHKTGAETIAGAKTFSSDITVEKSAPSIVMKDTRQTRGTAPSSNVSCQYYIQDTSGNSLTQFQTMHRTDGRIESRIVGYGQSGSWDTVGVCYPASGSPYGFAPTPDSYDYNDTRIATTAWVTGKINAAAAASDERKKTCIDSIPDAVLDAWAEVGFRQFKYREAVAEKGGNARLHLGVIAQRVIEAFKRHGLDAADYGLLCLVKQERASHWEDTFDGEGNVIQSREVVDREADEFWGIRYDEALVLECALLRRRSDALEARMAALERFSIEEE